MARASSRGINQQSRSRTRRGPAPCRRRSGGGDDPEVVGSPSRATRPSLPSERISRRDYSIGATPSRIQSVDPAVARSTTAGFERGFRRANEYRVSGHPSHVWLRRGEPRHSALRSVSSRRGNSPAHRHQKMDRVLSPVGRTTISPHYCYQH